MSDPSSSSTPPGATTSGPKLQTLNYANVASFFLNLIVTFGSSQFLPDNATLSAKYQTIITPAGYAFAIWGIIFTAELLWTVAQILPSYRSNELIIKGVGYNFVWANVAQTAWSIIFGLEQITLSLLAMIMILIPLVLAITNMDRVTHTTTTTCQYWLLKFPIQIHASWIMAATLVNTNVVLVSWNASATMQSIVSIVSLVVALVVGLYYTLKSPPVFVVPSVLSWATFAIASELASPRESITTTFTTQTIEQTRTISLIVASTVLATGIAKFLYDRIIANKPSSNGTENNTSSTDYSPIS